MTNCQRQEGTNSCFHFRIFHLPTYLPICVALTHNQKEIPHDLQTLKDIASIMQLKKYFKTIQIQTKNKYLKTYLILVVLRICLVFVPQLGYIHPDEFFQSVEVMAGEEFELEHTRTWEFNSTFPLRSIALPYVLYKMPLNVFRFVAMYVRYFLDIDLRTSYALLVFPRLIMCLVSFINDWSLYRICLSYGLRYDIRLLALASSFVSVVFGTRTFSNSIEMALCSVLLFIVADCMVHSNTVIFQREFLDEKYKASTTTVEKVKVYKMKSVLPSHTINKCAIISAIFVTGCFNRPTFLFYGMPIVFFWMLRGLGTKSVTFFDFNLRFVSLLACSVPIVCVFIVIDSLYYGFLTLSEIDFMEIGINNLVVTPLNFIRYNIDSEKTAAHGVHPKYMHLLVNVPLLYNVLGVVAIFSFFHMIYRFCHADYKYLPRAQSVVTLMNATIFVPLTILSLINHQEPRFLIPITLPVILLHAPKLITGLSTTYPFSTNHPMFQFIYRNILCTKASAGCMLKYWYTINIVLALFFGFIHQGGVIQLTSYLSQSPSNAHQHQSDLNANIHLVTSHLYNIPTSLLFIPSTKSLLINPDNGQKYTRKKQFFLYEYGDLPIDELQQRLKLILDISEIRLHRDKESYQLYLAIPSSLTEELSIELFKSNHTMIRYQRVKMFYPHLSMEAFPNFLHTHPTEIRTDVFNLDRICNLYENQKDAEPYSIGAVLKQFSSFIHQFGLILYRIEVRRRNTFSE